MRSHVFFFVTAVSAIAGCGINTDPTIFVDASVTEPSVAVEEKALGTAIKGGFTLSLHLGARAAGSSQIDLKGFQLTSDDQNTIVVDGLPLAATGMIFPIVVEPDTDEDVEITINYGNDLVAADVGQKICMFGSVRFRGAISDSLRGTDIPVLTDPVQVTGCAAAPPGP